MEVEPILTFATGHATVEPIASDKHSIKDVGRHRGAFGTFTTSTQTLIAFGPSGTECTKAVGSVEDTVPSATIFPVPSKSINLHLVFAAEFALYHVIKKMLVRNKQFFERNISNVNMLP